MTIQRLGAGILEETWELQGDDRDMEERQNNVTSRVQKVHGGAGCTMTEIREKHWELERQPWDCWAVMGALQDMDRRLGSLW